MTSNMIHSYSGKNQLSHNYKGSDFEGRLFVKHGSQS
jgi:hypothetical protein